MVFRGANPGTAQRNREGTAMTTSTYSDRPAETLREGDGCRNPRPQVRERGSRRNRLDAAVRRSVRDHGPR